MILSIYFLVVLVYNVKFRSKLLEKGSLAEIKSIDSTKNHMEHYSKDEKIILAEINSNLEFQEIGVKQNHPEQFDKWEHSSTNAL